MAFKVGFVVFEGFQLLQVAGPVAVFEGVSGYNELAYEPVILSETGGPVRCSAGVAVDSKPFSEAPQCDILFVSGGRSCFEASRSTAIANFIRSRAPNCRHVAGISTGSMVLAASGLLEGHRVTTHWSLNKKLASSYPGLVVEYDELFVRDRKIWTSSAAGGGMEIARLMIEEDLGADAASRAAREFIGLHKPEISSSAGDADQARFRDLIIWARGNLRNTLSVEELADRMGMIPRNFIPAFHSAMGQTPAKAIERIRLEEALDLIENTDKSNRAVAKEVGFTNEARMRRAFIRMFGVPPQKMREVVVERQQSKSESTSSVGP